MKRMLAGAAIAVFTVAFGGAASASMCTNDCDHSYTSCNAQNGGNAQTVCMPKWMQCKKVCTTPKAGPMPVSNVSKPRR